MGVGSGLYNALFLGHIFCAIVGFGAVYLNGVYGAESKKRQGVGGLAITEANFRVSKLGNYFIYAVPLFGFGLIGASDGFYELSETWVWASLLLYIVAMGLSHGILQPSVKKMIGLMTELASGPPPGSAGGGTGGPPPQVAELEGLGKKIAPVGAALDVMLVVILVLMIWKPGAS